MTEYIIAGVKADDEKVFMKRVGEMLEQKGLLEYLTDGVPVMIRITDPDELLKSILSSNQSYTKSAVEALSAKINSDFCVEINFRYVYETFWFKTMEDKDLWEKDSWNFNNKSGKEKSKDMTDEFPIEGKRYSTSVCTMPFDTEGIEVAFV